MITKRENFDLSTVTTFAIPAKCSLWVEYDDPSDIPAVLALASENVPLMHIGEGSNMLFTRDYPGVVAHSRVRGMEIVDDSDRGVVVRVGAGEKMDLFIALACDQGLWGVENLSGIPGEAGASAVQNVGAYGTEAADSIIAVHAYDSVEKKFLTIPAADCDFGYRDSMFKHSRGRYVIHHVDYLLSRDPRPNISYPAFKGRFENAPESPSMVREVVLSIRDSKLPDPATVPSAGSFFKNPVVSDSQLAEVADVEGSDDFPHYPAGDGWKIPAAWLLDRLGWKGRRFGNVAVWHLQPLVIVNPERKATATEILELEARICRSVYDVYGIVLTPEVEHI